MCWIAGIVRSFLNAEQLLARAIKATESQESLLKKAAALATRRSQCTCGAIRAEHLLTLGKIRRQQGLHAEAREAVESGLDIVSKLRGHSDLRMALTYLDALLTHELKYDARAITLLERVIAVPLHELTPWAVDTQLRACFLLIDLLTKAGLEDSIPAAVRRVELLSYRV